MTAQHFSNILVVRTDRIGDVILSLPMIEVLKLKFPAARISMMLRSYTKELAEGQEGLGIVLYDADGFPKPFFEMLSELRTANFDLAIVAFPRFRIALLLLLAGIPARIATGYRWYSFLFTTRVYEHRKSAEKHEADYNLSLLSALGCEIPRLVRPKLGFSEKDLEAAANIKSEMGLGPGDRVAILHPGSGGSARDWKPENFSALAAEMEDQNFKVIVTGSKGEESLVRRVAQGSGREVRTLAGRLNLKELGALIQSAVIFVSNSTGPLHIAAATGTPVIGFYPPILVASPERWGPLTDKKVIFVPDRNACPLCKGRECRSNVCMDQIEVRQVVQAAHKLAELTPTPKTS